MSNTSTSIPSPNGSIVTAGDNAAIIDTNGNTWTISSTNSVLENGQTAAFSANVAEIAYVSYTCGRRTPPINGTAGPDRLERRQ